MKRRTTARQSLFAIFAVPFAIGALSVIALVAALTGDGWRDILSWAGLAVPVLAAAWAMRSRRS